jgi:hydroxyacylglutathione hydrolase
MKIQYQNQQVIVFESQLYRTTSTLIDLGSALIIVDPNWLPIEVAFIKNRVDLYFPNHQQYLYFTHSDYDHIIGYQVFPDAKVIASEAFVQNPGKQEILQQITDFDHEYYINRPYPILYPKVDIIIEQDHQTLTIDNHSLIFYHATGHVSDGIFMIIPSLNLWIAGDYLSNIEMPFVDHDYNSYCNTLHLAERLIDQYPEVNILVPGHGDVATDRTEIANRIARDIKYLESLKNEDNQPNRFILDLIQSYSSNPNLIKAHQKNKDHLKSI